MADNEPILLAHLAHWIDENMATEALAFILSESAASRQALDSLLRDGGTNVPPITDVKTQVNGPRGVRVDLVCNSDGNEPPPVLIEVKFSAELTLNQPNNYLEWLLEGGNESILLFVAPEARIKLLWPELKSRVEGVGRRLSDVEAERRCMVVDDSRCHLMLVSWRTLLESMSIRTKAAGESPVIEANIHQLNGLAKRKNTEVISPFSLRYLELGPGIGKNREGDLKDIVEGVINRGVGAGWASKAGLSTSRSSSLYPYGRYFSLTETRLKLEVWLGVDNNRWKDTGKPLWLRFNSNDADVFLNARPQLPEHSDPGWIPLVIKADVEMNRVVEDLVSQLKNISDVIKADS